MEEQITIANLQNELEEVNQKLEQLEGKLAKESAVRERAEHDLQRALTAPEGTKQAHLESEEHYKLLLESTYDVVYAVTTEGIMTYLSPQISLFGYVPEELISNNFIEFVAPEQHQEVLHKFKTGTAAGESFRPNSSGSIKMAAAPGLRLWARPCSMRRVSQCSKLG